MAETTPTFVGEPLTGRRIPLRSRRLTVTQLMNRLSLEEQVALTYVRLTTDDAQLRAQLETMKDKRDSAQDKMIELDHPDTMPGQLLALSVLSALPEGTPGRIDPSDVAARLAAWRADYPQEGED